MSSSNHGGVGNKLQDVEKLKFRMLRNKTRMSETKLDGTRDTALRPRTTFRVCRVGRGLDFFGANQNDKLAWLATTKPSN